jgi:DNA-binding response OmpR family regulator
MRLLLAEDEVELSNAIVTILKHQNYSVDAVYDGLDAYDYLSAQEYDGAILDIMMPKLDGISVLKKLRSEGNSTPILMLTAKSELNNKIEGLDSGADDYLTKPFAMQELLARIRSITRRNGEVQGQTLSFSDLTLNRSNFTLTCGDKSIALSNKEFQMLEMMITNPKQIISQDQFMDKIWGLDSETEMSVVWVYISYLRKKLKDINSHVSIKATRNVGYSLVE